MIASRVMLYNMDCIVGLEHLQSSSIDLVVTDPPYEIETKGAGLYKHEDKRYIKDLEAMANGFSEKVLNELCRVMKKINIYFFCSQKQIIPLLDFFVKGKKCNYNILTWHKTNPVPACGNKYLTDTEFILFFREKGVKVNGSFDTKRTWYTTPLNTKDKKKYKHPTVKPVEIVKNLIINSSSEGEIVLDLFMGSGTTAVAANTLGRKFIGFEINKEYFTIAENRVLQECKEV